MGKIKNLFQNKTEGRSLRWQIGILYTILAIVNIIFFSVMIFENQSDLLLINFRYQSENLVKDVVSRVETLKFSREKDESFKKMTDVLRLNKITDFTIFDIEGKIWHRLPDAPRPDERVSVELKRKAVDLTSSSSIFNTRYSLDFNENDFTVNFVLPLKAADGTDVFFTTKLSVNAIRDRLRVLYYQIAIAVLWGVIFHILFAIFLFRVIFTRVGKLKETSNKMAAGDLTARALWNNRRSDELDDLGSAFNVMAEKIEETVETISRLNDEIQHELKIGKEVQELFMPSSAKLKDFHLTTFLRPMREVSGDVFNVFAFNDRYRGIFFADASGHGVSAALITTITLMSLDEIIRKTIKPREILTKLNAILSERLQSSFFATSVFFVIDNDGTTYFSNAGHNPPLAIRPSTGEVITIDKCGPPLGLMEDFEYPGKYINTKSQDRIFIYSDGLIETKNAAGEQFGIERVQSLLVDNAALPDSEKMILLKDTLAAFAIDYRDDVSALLVEIP